MAKKATLACKPCGTMVFVTDQGEAVIECYECGTELVPRAAKKTTAKKATKKVAGGKATAKKAPAAKKAAPKKKK